VALKIFFPDKGIREVTFQELVLANNLALKALVNLLLRKGFLRAEEYLAELQALQKPAEEGEEKSGEDDVRIKE